jgi:Flp pilus assembly protein TadG
VNRNQHLPSDHHSPFLRRLLHDRAANTLVVMAIALIPMSALAGSAIDMGRMYDVKARLQQACDAGVLAGRKFMDSTSSSATLDATATTQAKAFFANNFTTGWFDTAPATFVPVKTSDMQVAGTASVTVPMTVMKMFGATDTTISVACKARYDIADTDIIFVLDTTGSMACRPEDTDSQCNNYVGNNPAQAYTRPASDPDAMPGYSGTTGFGVPETTSGNGSRIKALRQAVKDFYSTVANSVDASTRVRYGFVTYTSAVNSGRAITQVSPQYMIGGYTGETAKYQSRRPTGDYIISTSTSANNKNNSACTPSSTRSPTLSPTGTYIYNTSGQATVTAQAWNSNSSKCEVTVQTMGPIFTYQQYDTDVTNYITGAAVADPSEVRGQTSRWEGCIEERQTESSTTTFTSNSYDLDPDLIPTTNAATRWKPMWPDVTYARNNYNSTANQTINGEDDTYAPNLNGDARRKAGFYSCGKPVHRLSVMTAAQVAAYVDASDFKPLGGTYHDTGMIWGTRMLSPNGIFAADNVGRAGQATPKRVIVFLTDGAMAPNSAIYGQYGVEYYDRRVSGGTFSKLTDYHNARFLYECDKARTMGIDVWTITLGSAANDQLTACARTSAQALATTTGSGLSSAFQMIAKQVAMLRVVQ